MHAQICVLNAQIARTVIWISSWNKRHFVPGTAQVRPTARLSSKQIEKIQTMASVGMMDPAYFVGKVELLAWLNELLKLSYTKVEQVGCFEIEIVFWCWRGSGPSVVPFLSRTLLNCVSTKKHAIFIWINFPFIWCPTRWFLLYQCNSGAAYCQIIDAIYPVSKSRRCSSRKLFVFFRFLWSL